MRYKEFHTGVSGANMKMTGKLLKNDGAHINFYPILLLDFYQRMVQTVANESHFILFGSLVVRHGRYMHIVAKLGYRLNFWLICSLNDSKV